jgi:serine/threonine protein kinase
MAPEMVASRDYGKALDIWAAGCVIYTLLVGKLPFLAVGNALYRAITAGSYSVTALGTVTNTCTCS